MYVVAAALIGVLGWYLVSLFAHLMIEFSRWAVSWGSGTARIGAIALREDMGSVGNFGVELIHFWNNCVATLAMAFLFSYFWTASTVIYFLLRRLVDATELDEVYLARGAGPSRAAAAQDGARRRGRTGRRSGRRGSAAERPDSARASVAQVFNYSA